MQNPSFADALDASWDEIERPKPLPTGTYQWAIEGMPEVTKSKVKQTTQVNFTVICLGAAPDVDQKALEEAGGFQGKKMRLSFWPTENAGWRLKEFMLDHLGIDENTTRGPKEALSMCAGLQFLGHVTHTIVQKDAQGNDLLEPFVRAEITKTAPIT